MCGGVRSNTLGLGLMLSASPVQIRAHLSILTCKLVVDAYPYKVSMGVRFSPGQLHY